jgi:DNA-binding XRE family transcriptional regulator
MSAQLDGYWPTVLREYRRRHGVSQSAFAQRLGVDQTSVSRWERGSDTPRPAAAARIRDLVRAEAAPRQDAAMLARVRHAAWPTSLVSRGAVFLEINASAMSEAGLGARDLRGTSIYGSFGEETDAVTHDWENTGIFRGDIAATISLNVLRDALGQTAFIRTLDTPFFTRDADIWCLCEIKRITEAEYHSLRGQFDGPMLAIAFG